MDRFPLGVLPTPLEPMDRLGAELGLAPGSLFVKRDDLTGIAGGGNKARKLEFLVGDALAQERRTLVTAGAVQSNHVRITAAAACKAGMECVVVLGGTPGPIEGNLVLDLLFDAELVWAGEVEGEALETVLAETCLRLAEEGRAPYEIPLGGASPIGTHGYVDAADELAAQAPAGALLYTATGTGGTQAGLVVGLGSHARVRGVDVGALDDIEDRIGRLVTAGSALADRLMPSDHLQLDKSQIGPGYAQVTEAGIQAIRLAARLEALVLDPVYSGKALAGLIADARAGRIPADQPVVFLHTGGLPSVFAADFAAAMTGQEVDD